MKIFTKRFRQDQLVTTRRRPAGPASHLFRIQVQFLEVSCAEAAKQQNFFFTAEVFSDQLNKAPLLRALHRPQRAWFLPPAPTATPPHFPSPGRLAPLISCDVSCCPTRFEISARIYLGMMSPPPTSSPPLTFLRVRDNLSCPPDTNERKFSARFHSNLPPAGSATSVSQSFL